MKYLIGAGVAVALIIGALFYTTSKTIVYEAPKDLIATVVQPTIKSHGTSTVIFTGDVMMGRNVENLMAKYGKDFPFRKMHDTFMSVDGVVLNLEGPILTEHIHTKSGEMRFSFPRTTPVVLAEHNVKLVSLANNHTGDRGEAGFKQTQNYLAGAGVAYAGHPFAYDDKYVTRFKIGDRSFVFVGFNLTNPNMNTKGALEFVKNIEHTDSEYVIAMVHGGDEYELTSNTRQQNFYRGLIDAGVDAVIAHHPHVVQEIEVYNNKPIFYSLGNFIFDQYFSKDVEEGLLLKLTLSDAGAAYELMPIKGGHSQPLLMNEAEKGIFLEALAKRSSNNVQEMVRKGELNIAP